MKHVLEIESALCTTNRRIGCIRQDEVQETTAPRQSAPPPEQYKTTARDEGANIQERARPRHFRKWKEDDVNELLQLWHFGFGDFIEAEVKAPDALPGYESLRGEAVHIDQGVDMSFLRLETVTR